MNNDNIISVDLGEDDFFKDFKNKDGSFKRPPLSVVILVSSFCLMIICGLVLGKFFLNFSKNLFFFKKIFFDFFEKKFQVGLLFMRLTLTIQLQLQLKHLQLHLLLSLQLLHFFL